LSGTLAIVILKLFFKQANIANWSMVRLFYLFQCLFWHLKREHLDSRESERWKNVAQIINIDELWDIYDLSAYASASYIWHVQNCSNQTLLLTCLNWMLRRDIGMLLRVEFVLNLLSYVSSVEIWKGYFGRNFIPLWSVLIEKYKRKHRTWNCQLLNKFHIERKEERTTREKVVNEKLR
jgi:hypothetical protein